jgi:hypothetical protein
LVIPPLTKCALSVKPQFSGAASGVNNAASRIAGLLAVAMLGAIVVTGFTAHLSSTLNQSSLSVEEQQQILDQADRLGGIVILDEFDEKSRTEARSAVEGSFVFGFRWALGVCAVLVGFCAVISVFTIHNAPRSDQRHTP